MSPLRSITQSCLLFAAGISAASGVTVSAPQLAPSSASGYVDHGFGSFSIAVHWFADYAGNSTTPNLFSRNLMQLLANKTGKAPYIRIGGTSGDRTNYIENQIQSIIIQQEGDNGIPLALTIGPTWFEGFTNFPGSKFHFQVNLAQNNSNGIPNAVAEARAALKVIGSNLESFEIGNECDLYISQSVRPANYTEKDYSREWNQHAVALTEQVLSNNTYGLDPHTQFQALTYAGGIFGVSSLNFSLITAFNNSGINSQGRVKSASLHFYQLGHPASIRRQNDFMNHSAIAGNLTRYVPSMNYLRQADPNVPFVLGESNSDYINLGIFEYTGVFGNALWVCDYLLYGMSLNITRIYLHQGTTFGYSAWIPITGPNSTAQVRPPFYGNLLVADVIGLSPTMQLSNINLGMWNISAYASYESGRLAKYVVINMDEWNTTTSYTRPVQTVSLSVPSDVTGAKVEYLTAAGANVDTGVTWRGMSYGFEDLGMGVTVQNDTRVVQAVNGVVNVEVQSTEAVVVTLLRSNGSGVVSVNGSVPGYDTSSLAVLSFLSIVFAIVLF